ncbi:16S rRNA (guanine(527)-N(7))-methyltransferase RsmG [Aquipuribacter nitratireducens]|uniref:Ribosomal RNA small subunit methyltransferase G n=1 Tax=Aquipuribacter nitratireducens TaxID=650104 RepID=A0ABW0GMX5_9MICO
MRPAAADRVFGEAVGLAERYVALLATSGTERGLIGPRETDRLWERHVLNCAVVEELVPTGAVVVDVGSGAGLPGIPLALARPDVRVELVEPLLRRTTWLEEVVTELGLGDRVEVTRGKAAVVGPRRADVVTSRAVASLDKLLVMSRRLARPGGLLLALKGASAEAEVSAVPRSARAGWEADITVARCGGGVVAEETTVVVARRVGG